MGRGNAFAGSVRNGGLKFAAHKKLPDPESDPDLEHLAEEIPGILGNGLPAKILHGNDDEDEETEKLRYRIAKAKKTPLPLSHGPCGTSHIFIAFFCGYKNGG